MRSYLALISNPWHTSCFSCLRSPLLHHAGRVAHQRPRCHVGKSCHGSAYVTLRCRAFIAACRMMPGKTRCRELGLCKSLLCAPPQSNPGLQKILSAAFGLQYGLMMVIVCGAELFTGNTATMTAAFWEGKATAGQVVKNWVCSYSGGF